MNNVKRVTTSMSFNVKGTRQLAAAEVIDCRTRNVELKIVK